MNLRKLAQEKSGKIIVCTFFARSMVKGAMKEIESQ
jgi:hypothetical protein